MMLQRDGQAINASRQPNEADRSSSQLQVNYSGRKPLFAPSSASTAAVGANTSAAFASRIAAPSGKDMDASRLSMGGSIGNRSLVGDTSAGAAPLRRTSSMNDSLAPSGRRDASPGGTRIPRLNSLSNSKRKPISLAEAFRMAQGEEDGILNMYVDAAVMDGSPSPAPRQWRNKSALDESKLRKALGEDHLDTKGGQSRIPQTRSNSSPNGVSASREPQQGTSVPKPQGSTVGIPRMSSYEGLSRDASTEPARLTGLRSARFSLRHGSSKLPDLIPGIEDGHAAPAERALPPTKIPSPERSFAWEMEHDFTAGDLQVSDSPRVRIQPHPFANRLYDENGKLNLETTLRIGNLASRNTKLDEIRTRELQTGSNMPLEPPRPRTYNTKLEEIRSRESMVEHQIPLASRHLDRLRNTKLDDIRQREANGLSKRAYAAIRLNEIREQNAMSRPKSPEPSRFQSRLSLLGRNNSSEPVSDATSKRETQKPDSNGDDVGRPIPDTPITVFKRDPRLQKDDVSLVEKETDEIAAVARIGAGDWRSRRNASDKARLGAHDENDDGRWGIKKDVDNDKGAKRGGESNDDDQADEGFEWVRRLARASSSSPAVSDTKPQQLQTVLPAADRNARHDLIFNLKPTQEEPLSETLDSSSNKPSTDVAAVPASSAFIPSSRRSLEIEKKPSALSSAPTTATNATQNGANGKSTKPTVGFAPTRRRRSTETSAKSKRSSMQSESDPTDRIEGERKLFDNQSDKGSTRPPSPSPSDVAEKEDRKGDDADTTPKPVKVDPLTMPTPKVTGAYVETPATVKVEKLHEFTDEERPREDRSTATTTKPAGKGGSSRPEPAKSTLRERKTSHAWRNKDNDAASDPGTAEEDDAAVTTSASVRRPRAKSLPRRRLPIKNTANPPSVKDDLRELQRANNFDDSTFDDLDEILSGRKPIKAHLQGLLQPPRDLLDDSESDLDHKSESPSVPIKKEIKDEERSDGELATIDRITKTLTTSLHGIRSSKQGIERLEDHFSKSEKRTQSAPPNVKNLHDHNHVDHGICPHCPTKPKSGPVAYLHLPMPRLYRREPKFRLSLLGLLFLVFSMWYALEWGMCEMYCKSRQCSVPGKPCVWSYTDPQSFGSALPIKLDQWVTGGRGREWLGSAIEETYDWYADMEDLVLGRKITDVNINSLPFQARRRHRRRLRKKGLAKPPPVPNAETKAKWDSWHQTRLAKERAQQARQMGYHVDDVSEETMGGDERVG